MKKKNEILIVKRVDNKCVTIRTNYDKSKLPNNVQRWSEVAEQKASVVQHEVFNTYNKTMGGVDKHDWLTSKYAT